MGLFSACIVVVTCLVAVSLGKPLSNKERPIRKFEFNGEVVYVPVENKFVDPFSSRVPGDEQNNDMILNEEQEEYIRQMTDGRSKRKAIRDVVYRWTRYAGDDNGDVIVPFQIDSPSEDIPFIYAAMEHWTNKACVQFVPYSELAGSLSHNQYLRFVREDGCWSYVGRQPTSGTAGMFPQKVSIGTGCTELGTVAHEIGHAMGFQHEQSRPDRDDYVDVVWSNIETSQRHNFDKYTLDEVMSSDVVEYDVMSVMHYGSHGFAIDAAMPTLLTKRPFDMQYIGQRSELSFYDVKLANYIYNCNSRCPSPLPNCANGGFVDKTCTCQCPPDWTGSLCTESSNVDKVVTEITRTEASGVITSPNYESGQYLINSYCMIYIQGQPGSTITLWFDDFDLESPSNGKCWDYVQVNTDDLRYGGVKYCGNSVQSPITATDGMMIWFSSDETVTKRGFKAHFTIDKPLTTSEAQAVTTAAPTEAPVVTTIAPTEAPVVTTVAPTEAPVVTTAAPTEAPVVTTAAPTAAPVVTTAAPTQAPVVTTTTGAPIALVQSPNYPNLYPNLRRNVWNIKTQEGQRISVFIIDMQIEYSYNCRYDVLIIDDYFQPKRFCGSRSEDGPFISTSNRMQLTFESDSNVRYRGFQLSYKAII
ncbi:blastula protease 10-like [Lytechinus variegatus]|uniref:blastula protease 10-like n=1 Tax=Lytechinus variegatus TaxID=7654 RepID=UPI001BB23693|nr:blastula protease 10-like [Lytechinus variegatus]